MVIERLWPGAVHLCKRVWVVHDPEVMAMRFGPWVILGADFVRQLTWDEVKAVILHELRHGWWHQLCQLVVKSLAPALLPAITWRHELQADDHAKRQGLGNELASALLKFSHVPQTNYPPISLRVRRLQCP